MHFIDSFGRLRLNFVLRKCFFLNLLELSISERATITAIEQNEWMLKLVEMGCYQGKTIEIIRRSILGDPICVKISDAVLILREEEAKSIKVQKCNIF
jgi:Fe2+ transport system protein FeoA